MGRVIEVYADWFAPRPPQELWKRIVFNMLVSNADDHLRNHGFLLIPNKGWRLSPAYDINPVPTATGLTLNVTEADNALDLDLAREVASTFRLSPRESSAIIAQIKAAVGRWKPTAAKVGISAQAQKAMASAFRLASTS